MRTEEFLQNCTACGGNWTAMLLTGIEKCFPETWQELPDRSYSYEEVCKILRDLLEDW